MTYIGIDVGKAVLEVAAVTATGEVSRKQFGNTAKDHQDLIAWLAQWQDCHIILEATSTYHQRLHQSLDYQTPAEVYFGSSPQTNNTATNTHQTLRERRKCSLTQPQILS